LQRKEDIKVESMERRNIRPPIYEPILASDIYKLLIHIAEKLKEIEKKIDMINSRLEELEKNLT